MVSCTCSVVFFHLALDDDTMMTIKYEMSVSLLKLDEVEFRTVELWQLVLSIFIH